MELLCERKNAKIYESKPWNLYEVKKPEFDEKELGLIDLINRVIVQRYSQSELGAMFLKDKKLEKDVEMITELMGEMKPYSGSVLTSTEEGKVVSIVSNFLDKNAPYVEHKESMIHTILMNLVGLGKISYFINDDELEEIMANKPGKPIFVFDRKYGRCKTTISFDNEDEMKAIISRIAKYVSKEVSREKPLLEARLPDGSRINATIPPASPHGPTMTITKFRKRPLTMIEIIANNTISSELAAFLWLCVEGMHVSPQNMLIVGGTGSGKTTTLNALSVFIPQRERIITIEDTPELNLFDRENWVQLESRGASEAEGLDLNALLKNTIRMRPDRIIVGEVRGAEAETMFTAMDVGHQGLMCTLHANSARDTLLRLQSPPMNVPKSMFTLLNLIIMQHRMYGLRKGLIRRVTHVSEVSVMGENVLLNDVYTLNREKDKAVRTTIPSQILEKLSFLTGFKKPELKEELALRTAILDYMVKKGIKDYTKIRDMVSDYYTNPTKVLKEIGYLEGAQGKAPIS